MSVVATKPGRTSLRTKVSAEEWQARVELACTFRLMAHFGWAGTSFGTHQSARIPDEPEKFLLNPVSVKFDQITASSFIKVNGEGQRFTESPYRVNDAGILMHGAIYRFRPELMGCIHSHSETGVAVSLLKCGLMTNSMTASRFYNRIGYYDFSGPGDSLEECEKFNELLGSHMALIMRNHGLTTVGRTVGEAMVVMVVLEQAIAIQLRAMATGGELIVPPAEILEQTAKDRDARSARNNASDWRSLMEVADRIDPSYRE